MAIDINHASFDDLSAVGAIGPYLAREIVEYREQYGPFSSIDELAHLPGVDEQVLMELRQAGVNVGLVEAQGSDDGQY